MSRNWEIAPTPALFPGTCTLCGQSHHPILDTHVDGPEGRKYVCKQCAIRVGKLWGFYGEEIEALKDVRDEADKLQEQVKGLEKSLGEEIVAVETLKTQLEAEQQQVIYQAGKVAQLKHVLNEQRRSTIEAINSVTESDVDLRDPVA